MPTTTDLYVKVTLAFRDFGESLRRATDALRRFGRTFRRFDRRPTSGHRHRGTRDWTLRYAPARKDVPLGLRTIAKVRLRAPEA